MKYCPRCGNNKFIVTAHVTQDWIVDQNGIFAHCITDCNEVTHHPDDDDIWVCENCNYSGAGHIFNVEN